MNNIDSQLLEAIADLHEIPAGAYNIRKNGGGHSRNSTANIEIVTKQDKPGIDIIVAPGTKNESVHIPVIITEAGVNDLVYNDFYIGDGADILIVAVSTTAVTKSPSTTVFTPSTSARMQKSNTLKSITVKATARAKECSTP